MESPFLARFECKYFIDPAILPGLRQFITPFARHDDYSARTADYRYSVSSLYLDSDDLGLYAQTVAGERERFKLRVRTYSDRVDAPVFLEVKQKCDRVVRKRRAVLDRTRARDVLLQRPLTFLDDLEPNQRRDLEFFNHCVSMTQARPVARIKYMREAFQAHGNEPVRVTIDSDLMHAATLDDNLSHGSGPWTETPTRGLILEIKYTDQLPSWAHELVRVFCINQRAVPKYVLSIDHMMTSGGPRAMTLAGRTVPPVGA